MSNTLTSDALVKSVKRRASIPSDQSTFTTEDILEILNEEMDMFGVEHLLSVHEEYLVYSIDIDLVSDQREYTIPYRAIGNKLRDVAYVSPDGSLYELSRISLEELSDFRSTFIDTGTDLFYVKNDKIVLVSEQQTSSAKLRMFYYLKPNSLTVTKNVATISNIDLVSGIITISNFPSDFSNVPDMDFVQHKSPNKIYSYDITPLSVNSTTKTVTFDSTDIPSDIEVGDYITPRTLTPVPQLPTELHPILAQRAAVAILESLGDTEGFQVASNRLQKMEQSVLSIIDNRVEGAPQKIVSRYNPLRETQKGRHISRSRKGSF